tara:strand:+ start:326 stop:571 length:246 start_codon:yes stop_codon:yes gene_type:complete
MIYTAIFQGAQGKLHRARYTGVMDKKDAWLTATRMGARTGECLIALVSGDHPVYFYENFVEDNAAAEDRTLTQQHDVYEMT